MRITIALERRPRIKEIAPLKQLPRPVDKQRAKDDELLAWLDACTDRREIRADAGWSQADVSRHIGCSPALVSKWEGGGVGWSRSFGLKYAALLKELEVMRDS